MILPPGLVDSHCHLDLDPFDADRDAVVERARAAGVCAIVNPGIDLEHSWKAIELAGRYPEVHACVGVHPNSSAGVDGAALEELRSLARHPRVVALGEIGLDYYWKIVEPEQQRAAFLSQLELAAELGLPVVIHCRDANADVAAILRDWVSSPGFRASRLARDREFAGVLHAYPGDAALAEEAYTWGFVLSLGGPVTFRNARDLHALVPVLRLDRLMLETDAPYLTPHPHRGTRNEPAYVALVAAQIAALKGTTVEAVAQATTAVAARFFGLENGIGCVDSPKHSVVGRSPG